MSSPVLSICATSFEMASFVDVRIVAHTQICNLLDVLHLADSSPLLEVEGCGESSIPVSIVVPKFLPMFCDSLI